MFGVDCRSPTEATFLPVPAQVPTDIKYYREKLTLSLSSVRELANYGIRHAQQRYKKSYDRKSLFTNLENGCWSDFCVKRQAVNVSCHDHPMAFIGWFPVLIQMLQL